MEVNLDSTDGNDCSIYDPTEAELYRAYANGILDKLAADVKLLTFNNGNIKGSMVQKLIRRWKRK